MKALSRSKVGAIVLGGAHGSLAVLRSLGRRGIPVWFIAHDHVIPKFSRYCSKYFIWEGPSRETAAADLVAFGDRHNLHGWVLFCGADAEVKFIGQNHATLSSLFCLTTPAWEVARYGVDKRLTHECATAVGVSYPRTYYPRSAKDLGQIDCSLPLILKPTMRLGRDRFSSAKAWLVTNPAELVARYLDAATLVDRDTISVQEFIPGTGAAQYSYAALCHQGQPIASLTARRKRQYPIDCGTASCVEIVDEPRVDAASRRVLQHLSYDGLVEIEFKYDVREDEFKLLDFNARPWAWIGLGGAAGVDFPLMNWQLATGQKLVSPSKGPDATWLHLSRDVLASCAEIARGNFARGPSPKRRTFAAFAGDDPLPGFIDLPLTLWRMVARLKAVKTGAPPARMQCMSEGRSRDDKPPKNFSLVDENSVR